MLVRTEFGIVIFDYHKGKCIRSEFIREDFLSGEAARVACEEEEIGYDELKNTIDSQEYFLSGTEFEVRAWQAIKEIPVGHTRTYQEIAEQLVSPRAARAVGNACANNKLALIIPCHRVVPKSGIDDSYRWGATRKLALLQAEREYLQKHMMATFIS